MCWPGLCAGGWERFAEGDESVRDLHRRLGVVVGLAVAVLAYAVVHVHTATGV